MEHDPEAAAAPPPPRFASPPLFRDRSFLGMTATQFLGAFNDNLFKQLVLLLAVSGAAGAASKQQDQQWQAMAVFSLPFILFSSYAGFLSEQNSKRTVIVLSKIAEIVIMLLGVAAFSLMGYGGMSGVLLVLFLMGAQSAFFGPGKYGILPELFAASELPKANGIILMTTFLAIIFGTALAGLLLQLLGDRQLWLVSSVCVLIAAAGTWTSLWVRYVPPADPCLRFTWSALLIPRSMRDLLARDRQLLLAILVNSLFWLIGGVVHPTVNAVGELQFRVGPSITSGLAACMGIGIALGSVLAIRLSHGKVNFALVRAGAWLIAITLLCLSLSSAEGLDGLSDWPLLSLYAAGLVLLGVFAGIFAVPLQVFLQVRPPESLKGRTIATNNLANWVAIVASAGIYGVMAGIVEAMAWQRTAAFAMTAVLMLPVALFYRPRE